MIAEINERSSHSVPTTPHGGGIAIAVTWFVGLVYYLSNVFLAFVAAMVVLGVSMLYVEKQKQFQQELKLY